MRTALVLVLGVIALPPPLGAASAPFQVSTADNGRDVAVAGGAADRFMLVWTGYDNGQGLFGAYNGIIARRTDGRVSQGSDFIVNAAIDNAQLIPDVAWIPSTNRFAVVWGEIEPGILYFDTWSKVYADDGTVQVPDYRVNEETRANQTWPAVAAGGPSGEIIVWDDEHAPFVLTGQWQSPSDFLVFAPPLPNNSEVWGENVAVSGTGVATVVWGLTTWPDLQPGESAYGTGHLFGCRLAAPGTCGSVFQIDSAGTPPGVPDVASDRAGNSWVVWTDDATWSSGPPPADTHILARRYDAAGNSVAGPFRVNSSLAGKRDHASVASDANGNVMVVWESGEHPEIRGRRYTSAGVALGPDFPVASRAGGEDSLRGPDVGVDAAGNFLVAWDRRSRHPGDDTGIFARRYAACGSTGDADGDGHCANDDDCPSVYNPDQRDADGTGGGDLCDSCPSGSGCIVADSGAATIGGAGGTVRAGNVTLDVPAGAVGGDTSFSVTSAVASEYGLGITTPTLDVVQLGPEGVTFEPPVTVTFSWPDANGDGDVDGVTPRLRERNLVVYQNGVVATRACDQPECQPGNCEAGTTCGLGPLAGRAGVCCDRTANTWKLPVSSFSEFVVGAPRCPAPMVDTCHPERRRCGWWRRLRALLGLREPCCVAP